MKEIRDDEMSKNKRKNDVSAFDVCCEILERSGKNFILIVDDNRHHTEVGRNVPDVVDFLTMTAASIWDAGKFNRENVMKLIDMIRAHADVMTPKLWGVEDKNDS